MELLELFPGEQPVLESIGKTDRPQFVFECFIQPTHCFQFILLKESLIYSPVCESSLTYDGSLALCTLMCLSTVTTVQRLVKDPGACVGKKKIHIYTRATEKQCSCACASHFCQWFHTIPLTNMWR